MKRNYFVIVISAAVLATVAGSQFFNKPDENQNVQTLALSEPAVSFSELEPQINSKGSVTISVAPHRSVGSSTWEFEITLDTHSVELSEDLTRTAVLMADGKNYYPIAWDGDPPGGHHREGILQFAPTSPPLQSIALKISNVGGVEERDFVWQLKPR